MEFAKDLVAPAGSVDVRESDAKVRGFPQPQSRLGIDLIVGREPVSTSPENALAIAVGNRRIDHGA